MYCRQIHRVKYRLGLWRTRQIINLTELEEWMDRKNVSDAVLSDLIFRFEIYLTIKTIHIITHKHK